MGKDQAQDDVVTSRFWVAGEAAKARRKAILDLRHGAPGNVGYTDESGKFSCFNPLKLPFKAIRCESSLRKRRPFVRRYTARGYTTYN